MFSLAAVDGEVDLAGAVARVVDSHNYVLGPSVTQFEERFADYCGVGHSVGVANGTDALELAARALDVGRGSRVIVVANAGHYGSTALRSIGALPVYADVDPDTLTLSPAALAGALARSETEGPIAAVIVTHLYGQLADMDALLALTEPAGIPVIEDCAQAHGARRDGRRAGSFGRLACFSFYPTKNLGAIGDGGAVVTDDTALAERIRKLRQYGWGSRFRLELPDGRNSRLDELQASVLLEKLPNLDGWNAQRRAIARRYVEGLAALPLELPASTGEDHVSHLFVIRTPQRDALGAHLAEAGIGTAVHYPVADHQHGVYADDQPTLPLPVTESATDAVLTLPCYPGLARADQDLVIEAVRAFFDSAVA